MAKAYSGRGPIQGEGLFRAKAYEGLFRAKAYSGRRPIQGEGLFRARAYSGRGPIQVEGLFRSRAHKRYTARTRTRHQACDIKLILERFGDLDRDGSGRLDRHDLISMFRGEREAFQQAAAHRASLTRQLTSFKIGSLKHTARSASIVPGSPHQVGRKASQSSEVVGA